MAPFWGISAEEAVKSIAHTVPPTSDSLVFLCEESLPKIMEQTQAKLILLDSIATHFRSEYGDARQLFPERQQKANRILHALKRMAVAYNALVLLTNQVTGNVDAQNKYSKKYAHSMGYIVGHESQVRLLLEAIGSKGARRITVEKAVDLANNYCMLVMTEYGFLDPAVAKEKKIKPPERQEVLITPLKKSTSKKTTDDDSEEEEPEGNEAELNDNDFEAEMDAELELKQEAEAEISESAELEPDQSQEETLELPKKTSKSKSKSKKSKK